MKRPRKPVAQVARYVSAGLLLAPCLGEAAVAQSMDPPSPTPDPNPVNAANRAQRPTATPTVTPPDRLLPSRNLSNPLSLQASLPVLQSADTVNVPEANGSEANGSEANRPAAASSTPDLVAPPLVEEDGAGSAGEAAIADDTADDATTELLDSTVDELQPLTEPEAEAPEALRIRPRLGFGHTSSGPGYDGTTRLEGFIPLGQTVGEDVVFSEARLLVDNDGQVGGNLVLGYRTFDAGSDRTYGGYVAFDHRNTGNNGFNQLGLGLETLGTGWDARLNGYIPIGDQQQGVREGFVDTFFEERSLFLTRREELEAAMGGLDFEAGGRLARLGRTGDLRGYGGLYWYDAPGSPSTVGWRLRMEARPSDTVNLGVALQQDALFGTNVVVSVGVNVPGSRPRDLPPRPDTALARLGETVGRNASIVVDYQTEEENIAATNPTTGETYVFQHVNLGAAGGNGTIENPYGTVAEAIAAAESDGNHIVYVQAGTDPGIPGFRIPDDVAVLSTGPEQFVDTVEVGLERLPLSGSGQFPQVTDSVIMGNNSTLSGFQITGTTGAGVIVRNVGNAIVRDNAIRSTVDAGVLLQDATGTILLVNNQILGDGVAVIDGQNIENLTVLDSELISQGSDQSGLILQDVFGAVRITDSTLAITDPTEHGIAVRNLGAGGSVAIALTEGQIETNNPDQAGLSLIDNQGDLSFSGLTVTSTNGPALDALNVETLTISDSSLTSTDSTTNGITLNNVAGAVTISDTAIALTNPVQHGLAITNSAANVAIAATPGTITTSNPDQSGIFLENNTGDINLSGFDVTSDGGAALTATQVNRLAIAESTLSSNNSSSNGITLSEINIADLTGVTVAIADSTDNGILIDQVNTATLIATPGSTITNPGDAGVRITNSEMAEVSGLTITNAGTDGIVATDSASITLEQNTIEGATENGIRLENLAGAIAVRNSAISGSGLDGLAAVNVTGTAVMDTLEISESGGNGISLVNDSGSLDLTLSNTTVSASGDRGILINSTDTANLSAVIENNTITASGSDGLALLTEGTSSLFASVRSNTLQDNTAVAGTAGLNAIANDTSNICAQLQDNTSSNGSGLPGFNLQQNVGDPEAFDAEIGVNNIGTLTTSATEINSVGQGTCGFSAP